MKDNCYVSNTQVYLGKLVEPVNLISKDNKEYFSTYSLCRNIIFTPGGYNCGIDLVYKCCNYPIASKNKDNCFTISKNYFEPKSEFKGVIIHGTSLEDILKVLFSKDILSTKDILSLKNILINFKKEENLREYQEYLKIFQEYDLGYEPYFLEQDIALRRYRFFSRK